MITAEEAERRVLILENPGLQRRIANHAEPLRRTAAHPARRDRAQPSPRHLCAALRPRGRRRVHRRRRRARHDETGRLHPDAVVDLPRSRQSRHRPGGLARRPRHSDHQLLRHAASPSGIPTSRSPSRAAKATRSPATGPRMLPLEYTPARPSSPMVTYPYARSRDALELLSKSGAPDPRHGVKLQYVNPATGGYPLTTIGAFLQLLPKGFNGQPYRSTDATVVLRRRGPRLEHDWRPHVHLGTARHLRRALVASGRAPRAGRIRVVQLFRQARAEGAGTMARRHLAASNLSIWSFARPVMAAGAIALTFAAAAGFAQKPQKQRPATGRCTTTIWRHAPLAAHADQHRQRRHAGAGRGRTSWAKIERPARSPAAPSSRRSSSTASCMCRRRIASSRSNRRQAKRRGATSSRTACRRDVASPIGPATRTHRRGFSSRPNGGSIALNAARASPRPAFGNAGEIDMVAPVQLGADALQEPAHRRHQRIARRRARVRRADRRESVGLPLGADSRRTSQQHVEERQLEGSAEHLQLGVLANARRGPRHSLRRRRSAWTERLLGSRSPGRQPLRQLARGARRRHRQAASGTSRRCTTICGTTTCRRRRRCST